MVKRVKNAAASGKDDDTRAKVVVMPCCPDREGKALPDELNDEICIKLGKDLGERGNVVMTRLDNADLQQIDALVEVEAFRSRSEAAAFFIKQGIQARQDLFERVMPTVEKIRSLKEQAQKALSSKKPPDTEVTR